MWLHFSTRINYKVSDTERHIQTNVVTASVISLATPTITKYCTLCKMMVLYLQIFEHAVGTKDRVHLNNCTK